MSRLSFCCFVSCIGVCINSSAQSVPYAGFINSDQIAVRSGPGRVHYATAYLEQGESVEVWRHDPGGWCAVRPPGNSYSLVPVRQVEMHQQSNVGRIKDEGALAWVGTNDESVAEFLWQVRLQRDELVEVLGKISKGPRGNNVPVERFWYKIAPPAGEFRWIHEKHITRQPFQLVSNPPVPASAMKAANEVGGSDAPSLVTTPTFVDVTPNRVQTTNQRKDEPPKVNQLSEDFDQQVRSLDIALSRLLAQNTENWRFDSLREQATAVLGRATTDLQRGQALRMASKIDEFDNLKRKLDSNESPPSPLELKPGLTTNLLTTSTTSLAPSPILLKGEIDPRFHGVGWLVQVRSRRQGVPQFALTDKDGRIRQYISPSPGFNLNRYLKKEVGVYGQRGFIQSLRAPHLTALRVVELDRHRR